MSEKKPASNVWAEWIDLNRAKKRADPLPIPKNLAASKSIGGVIPDKGERSKLLKAFLDDDDRFLVSNGHALCLFLGRVEAYRNGGGQSAGDSGGAYYADEDVYKWSKQKEAERRAAGDWPE